MDPNPVVLVFLQKGKCEHSIMHEGRQPSEGGSPADSLLLDF